MPRQLPARQEVLEPTSAKTFLIIALLLLAISAVALLVWVLLVPEFGMATAVIFYTALGFAFAGVVALIRAAMTWAEQRE